MPICRLKNYQYKLVSLPNCVSDNGEEGKLVSLGPNFEAERSENKTKEAKHS